MMLRKRPILESERVSDLVKAQLKYQRESLDYLSLLRRELIAERCSGF